MQKDIAGCWLFQIVLGLRPPQVFVFVKQVSLFAKWVQNRTERCERGRWKPNQLAVLDDHSCTNHETHRLNCVGLYFFLFLGGSIYLLVSNMCSTIFGIMIPNDLMVVMVMIVIRNNIRINNDNMPAPDQQPLGCLIGTIFGGRWAVTVWQLLLILHQPVFIHPGWALPRK